MNDFLNHQAIQESKKHILEMKEKIDRISLPSETIEAAGQNLKDIKGQVELIDSDISSMLHQLSDTYRLLQDARDFLNWIKAFLIINSIFTLGALAWVIVKLYR